jgi:hypothetical protein
MRLIIDGFVNATIILAVIYFIMCVLAIWTLMWLNKKSSGLNTRKLFVMSCFLTSVLRCMSFIAITALNMGNYRINTVATKSYDNDLTQIFFDKACIVLFDFPDFPCVSAYMLLAVLWAEAFIQVRLVSIQ